CCAHRLCRRYHYTGITFFFFQAEDGIRDRNVTGVQTCALPICSFLYLVLRVGTHYRRTLNYGKALLKLSFATITSVLLSAVLLVPEIIAVTNSTRTGSLFANGLKTYPLYYYLFLPKSLINGGQWYFMFWSALGIVSIGFITLVYIYSRPRKYPLLTISLGL